MVTKVLFPKIRLQEMLNRPGGISREDALLGAMENVRSISGEGDQQIEDAIVKIEAIAISRAKSQFSPEDLKAVLILADQIVTLAGTFGYSSLDRATKNLCDMADGLLHADRGEAAPILVHVRAVRLFAPSATALGEEESQKVLAELEKIKMFYNFAALSSA
jgi:hypothetical protein